MNDLKSTGIPQDMLPMRVHVSVEFIRTQRAAGMSWTAIDMQMHPGAPEDLSRALRIERLFVALEKIDETSS